MVSVQGILIQLSSTLGVGAREHDERNSMSGFTMSSGIALVNVDGHIDIYVKNVGGTLSLFHDNMGTNSWGADPHFEVPKDKKYAVYFRMTLNTDTGTTFPSAPLDWGTAGMPSTITCEKMLTSHLAFSIKVDNSSPPQNDENHDFDLLVDSPTRGILRLHMSEIDPTIVEEGEEGEGGGITS